MGSKDTKIDDVMKVCRLCLGNNDLISVFDDRIKIPENIIDVIKVTTGVIISPSDDVSHKLCNKCLHITIKMYKFRSSSIVNDMELKTRVVENKKLYMNKSVEILLKKYPNIILSPSITKCNISTVVVVNRNEISNWIEKHTKVKSEEQKLKESKEFKKTTPNTVLKNKMSPEVVDLEDEIMPHLIRNKEISPPLQSPNSTETDQEQLPTSAANLSPVMPKLTLEIDKQQKPIQKEISHVDVDKIVSESIISTKIEDNKSKRKLSVSPNSDKLKKFKADTNSVDIENAVDSLVTLKYVTKSLLICDICNGILYSTKDLKKHKMNHMRCHLCKRSFRSLEETKEHSEGGCAIKQIMSNLPTIKLKRCDQSKQFRDQHPYLFGDSNNSIEQVEVSFESPVELATNHFEESNKDPLEIESTKVKEAAPSPDVSSETEQLVEILLISDDENEVDQSLTSEDNINQNSCDGEAGKSTSVLLESDTTSSLNNLSTRPKKNKTAKTTNAVQILSTASVKPDIKIIGENILDVDLDDNDISLLKNILKRTKKNLKETGVQTDMPCNADILPSLNKDKLFELKNLKKLLNFYKIPVNVSFAAQYSVRYSYEPSPFLRKDRSWSRIAPRVITSSRTSPVNDILQTKTFNNNTSHQVMNKIPPQALSSGSSSKKSITSIPSVSDMISKTTLPPLTAILQKESACCVTSSVPTIFTSTASNHMQSINNLNTAGPSTLPPLTAILQKESACCVVTSSVPTIFTSTASNHMQSINNLNTAGPSTLSNCYATDRNSYTKSETLSKSLQSSTIQQKTVNYKLPNNSILSQTLTKLTPQQQNYGVSNNNYISSNSKNYSNVTGAPTIINNFGNLLPLTAANYMPRIPGVISVSTPNTVFIPPMTRTSIINPTASVSSVPPSQHNSNLQSSSIITSNPENSSGSNFVSMIRVKDVSELR